MPTSTSAPRFLAVFLDVGGTLLDERDYPLWVELGRDLGIVLDESHLAHAYLEVERAGDTATPPPHEERWRSVLSKASGTEVASAIAEEFYRRLRDRPETPRLFSDARRCLVQLRAEDRRLGVISNSRSEDHLRALLARAGIADFFEVIVSSGTEGFAKPDPRLFARALARMQVAASDSFYVGDLPYRDAKAARAAGIDSVWLNREGTGFGDDPPEITSLTELPFYLRSLEGTLDLGRSP